MLTGAENWHRPSQIRPQRESSSPTRSAGTEARVIHFNDAATRASSRGRSAGADAGRRSTSAVFAPAASGQLTTRVAGAPTSGSMADRALRAQLLGQLAAAQSQASALVAVREIEEQASLSNGRSVARAQVRRGLQQASAAVGGVRRSRADDLRRAALRLITGR